MAKSYLHNRALIAFSKSRKARQKTTFLDLPIEIRLKIYELYFENSYIRFYYRRNLDPDGLFKGIATKAITCCAGPSEHVLLRTCRQVYFEALPVLGAEVYVLFDHIHASNALQKSHHGINMNPYLHALVLGTKKLVMSHPGSCWGPLPKFPNLQTIEFFGFYPSLRYWLESRSTFITAGWTCWYFAFCGFRSRTVSIGNPTVNFSGYASGVHRALHFPNQKVQVVLRAWCLAEGPDESKWYANSVLVDLDTKKVIKQQPVAFHSVFDRIGRNLEYKLRRYHDFLLLTERRQAKYGSEPSKLRNAAGRLYAALTDPDSTMS